MAWVIYDGYLTSMATGPLVDIGTDTIKIALVTSSYTPNRATHANFSDITNEVTGTNYTAGGNAVANCTCAIASNVLTFDGDDPATWSQHASGFSNARIAILYKDTTVGATSRLIAYNTFASDKGNVDGDLTIQLAADGIFTLG